jgi:DNA-binding CsgD family transcriptional regulator
MATVVSAPPIPGDVQRALADMDVPAYAIDTLGVVRWQNAASIRLVGDARGRQFTTVISPQQALEARETFTRNILGAQGTKDAAVELVQPDGKRVKVEICSAPLLDEHRVVGMFGLATRVREPTPPPKHPHLTPRQHQILHLLARGASTEQMAAELHLQVVTIRNHVRRLLQALGVHSRLEAIVVARRDGLLD